MEEREYKEIDAYRASFLKMVAMYGDVGVAEKVSKKEDAMTPAKLFGLLAHDFIQTGGKNEEELKKLGNEKLKTYRDKYEDYQQFKKENEQHILFDIPDAIYEVGLIFEQDGMLFKAKADYYNKEKKELIEIKTTRLPSQIRLGRNGEIVNPLLNVVSSNWYDMQIYMQIRALEANGYEVEKASIFFFYNEYPYSLKKVGVDYNAGAQKFHSVIELLKEHLNERE